jgi:hypothetical protein
MIDFSDNAEARLAFAQIAAQEERVSILLATLDDGSWEKAPARWMQAFYAVRTDDQDPVARIRSRFVECVVALPDAERKSVHVVLPEMIRCGGLTAEHMTSIVQWFLKIAGPSEAALGATILHFLDDPLAPKGCENERKALIAWLLRNGGAELRTSHRVPLLVDLVVDSQRRGDRATTDALLRLLTVNDGRLRFVNVQHHIDDLLHALDESNELHLAGDFLMAFDCDGRAGVLHHVLHGRDRFRNLHHRLLQGAADGLIDGTDFWLDAFHGTPPAIRFRSRAALADVARRLHQWAFHGDGRAEGPSDRSRRPFLREWTALVATECLRAYATTSDPSLIGDLCMICVHGSPAMLGMHEALTAFAKDERVPVLLVALLEKGPDAAEAAVLALKPLPTANVRRDAEWCRSTVQAWLDAVDSEPIEGVLFRKLMPHVREVVLADQGEHDSVRIDGEQLFVDRSALARALDGPFTDKELHAIAVLYVVHELVHREQHVGGVEHVRRIRAAGGETTLLHIDLAADHVAAKSVARAFKSWTFEWLRELQGRSVAAFPTGPLHTMPSRVRKARRLVSLRADLLIRPCVEPFSGYVFVDHSPLPGPIFALSSGSPMRVLAIGELDEDGARILHSAGAPECELSAIDRALGEAFTL